MVGEATAGGCIGAPRLERGDSRQTVIDASVLLSQIDGAVPPERCVTVTGDASVEVVSREA